VALAPGAAAADVAPPPEWGKEVSYAFTVVDVSKFADFVVLAYPTSQSNDAPTAELALVNEGAPVTLGQASPVPKLYAMKRADFEAWKAGYTPTQAFDDPVVQALLAKATLCDVRPSPSFTASKLFLGDTIVEEILAKKIDATTCDLEGPPSLRRRHPPAPPDATSTPDTPSAAAPQGGCASCTIEEGGAAWAGLASLGAALLVLVRGGSRKPRRRR
jgi:hypothetical protein